MCDPERLSSRTDHSNGALYGDKSFYTTVRPSPPPPLPGVFVVDPPKQQINISQRKFNIIQPSKSLNTTFGHPNKIPAFSGFNGHAIHPNQSEFQSSSLDIFDYQLNDGQKDFGALQPLIQNADDTILPGEENVYHTLQPVPHNVFEIPSSSEPKIYQQLQPVLKSDFSVGLKKSSDPKLYQHLDAAQIDGSLLQKEDMSTYNDFTPVCPSGRQQKYIKSTQQQNNMATSYAPPHYTSSKLYQQLRQPLNKPLRMSDQTGRKTSNNLLPVTLNNFEQSQHLYHNQEQHIQTTDQIIFASQGRSTPFPHLQRLDGSKNCQDIQQPITSKTSLSNLHEPSEISNSKHLPSLQNMNASPDKGFQSNKPKVYLELRNPSIRHQSQTTQRSYQISAVDPQFSNRPPERSRSHENTSYQQLHSPYEINESITKQLKLPGPYEFNLSQNKSESYKLPKILCPEEYTTSPQFTEHSNFQVSTQSGDMLPSKYSVSSVNQSKSLLSLPKAPVCYGDSNVSTESELMTSSVNYNKTDSIHSPLNKVLRKPLETSYFSHKDCNNSNQLNNDQSVSNSCTKLQELLMATNLNKNSKKTGSSAKKQNSKNSFQIPGLSKYSDNLFKPDMVSSSSEIVPNNFSQNEKPNYSPNPVENNSHVSNGCKTHCNDTTGNCNKCIATNSFDGTDVPRHPKNLIPQNEECSLQKQIAITNEYCKINLNNEVIKHSFHNGNSIKVNEENYQNKRNSNPIFHAKPKYCPSHVQNYISQNKCGAEENNTNINYPDLDLSSKRFSEIESKINVSLTHVQHCISHREENVDTMKNCNKDDNKKVKSTNNKISVQSNVSSLCVDGSISQNSLSINDTNKKDHETDFKNKIASSEQTCSNKTYNYLSKSILNSEPRLSKSKQSLEENLKVVLNEEFNDEPVNLGYAENQVLSIHQHNESNSINKKSSLDEDQSLTNSIIKTGSVPPIKLEVKPEKIVRKYKKRRYITNCTKSHESTQSSTEHSINSIFDNKKKTKNVPNVLKSVEVNITLNTCNVSEINRGRKRSVKKVDYRILNGGEEEEEEDFIKVKKRKYTKRLNFYKVKEVKASGLLITNTAAVRSKTPNEVTENKTPSIWRDDEEGIRKKRKYSKRAVSSTKDQEIKLDEQIADSFKTNKKIIKEGSIGESLEISSSVQPPPEKLKEEFIDPLEGGLISENEDEVVFLGFDMASEDEETILGFDFNSAKDDLDPVNSIGQLEVDFVTVDCDPRSLMQPPPTPCPQCAKTFSSHQDLVNHLQWHSAIQSPHSHSYVCSVCFRGFPSQDKLEKHIKWNHEGGKRFSCPVCPKRFTTKAYVKRHVETIHKDEKSEENMYCGESIDGLNSEDLLKTYEDQPLKKILHQCEICLRSFEKFANLQRHMISHSDADSAFPCMFCNQTFSSKELLHSHWSVHKDKQFFKCETCDSEFTAANSLKRHKLLHAKEKLFRCEICQRSFSLLSTLKTHLLIHTGARRYECRLCHKTFNRRDVLNAHQWVHTGEKKFQCDICKQKFRWKHAVKSHKLIYHFTTKPFVCKVCGKKFSHPDSFKKHAQVHSDRLFLCQICLKSFSRPNTLKTHIITHTDLKPFFCNLCNKRFRSKSHLKSHFLVHTMDKPWLCKFCNKTYKDHNQLRRHKRLVHCKAFYKKVLTNTLNISESIAETENVSNQVWLPQKTDHLLEIRYKKENNFSAENSDLDESIIPQFSEHFISESFVNVSSCEEHNTLTTA